MPPTQRVISRLYVTIIGLVVVVAALVGALLISLAISHQTTNCINTTLSDRNGVTATDAQAHVDFARGLEQFTRTLARNGAPSSRDLARLSSVTDHYERVLSADQAYRQEHPLGKC